MLAGTELWERFSFYGMQSLLMLYMTKQLLLPGHADQVAGMAAYRSFLAAAVGPMSDLALAAQTFGLYSGLTYVTPLIGAWIADRLLGKTRTITIGALFMAAGHLTMASERLFLLALLLLIVGTGLLTGNLAAQVGQLYGVDDDRRTRAFGIYLMALNVGSLAAPLICGSLGEKVAWHWGFGAAGVGMLIGLVTYLLGRKHLPPERAWVREKGIKLTRADRRRIFGILLALVPYMLASAALNQAYGLMLVWADSNVGHTILGWTVPITWVLTADGVFTIAGIAFATTIWKRLAAQGREPHDVSKVAIACIGIGLGYLGLALAARWPVVPLTAFVSFYLVADFSIGWLEAPTASMTSRDAPAQVNAMMMAVFKLAFGVAYFLVGWLGRFYEPLGASGFWLLNAGIAGTGLLIIALFGRRIVALLEPEHGTDIG